MKIRKFLAAHLRGLIRNVYSDFIFNPLFEKFSNNRPIIKVYNDLTERLLFSIGRKPLWDFVKKTKPRRILEIGLGNGNNAKKMMKLANDCEYYCFDGLYLEESKEAYEDLKDKDSVSFFIGDTKKILPGHVEDLPKMDLIFIDGGHDYETVKSDWGNCRKLMHRDTACFFHDHNYPGVKRTVNEIGEGHSKKIIIMMPPLQDFALVMKDKE